MVILYLYMLKNDHNKSSEHPSPCVIIFFSCYYLFITFVFNIMYLIFLKPYADKIKQNQWRGECLGVC